MSEFKLRLRRYDPESGEAPYWQEYTVDLEGHRSVLEGILQAKNETDGSIGIRCSCRAAICGSCGVLINGQTGLACHTHLDKAARHAKDGVIEVEPMSNMPVIKDLIVDMDAVHWKKIQRVTPWLINKEPIPEREYVAPHEAMVDITQSMACIQCGACVSSCLSMEIDPLFVGPAALAKSYRFVGDPRDAQQYERLKDLAEDPHGMYDCTHCFNCIEACPKGVAPMNQIMRLRRVSGDHDIVDRNNGHRHEKAFVSLVKGYGLLHEAELLPRSYGGDSWFGKFHPAAGQELLDSLPVVVKGLVRRKMNPKIALFGHKLPKDALGQVQRIYDTVESRDARDELNLYITGYDEDDSGAQDTDDRAGGQVHAGNAADQGQPGQEPEESPAR
ncbi:MAG: succinate dehydrogenase/fumarate reductase iron-sulfur subunit [Actinomycetota bacterium]|nr:succinate dehydrogenase/fumarate reductase iron-sulfur subunit [Actinomycetota bacterium]MDQ5807613.1 succinate dehydrogenase/fumarate reductase iron-sulfur subunit [Actinomycetota bacterium]